MKMNESDYELVSVVIPAYNCEKTIEKTVDSVINQTYKNLEIIIINDGSTDNTWNCLEQLSNKYSIVKCFNNSNHGVSYTRNFGIKNASGKYLLFLDSDDTIDKETINHCVTVMNNSNVELVIFGMNFIDYGTNNIEKRGLNEEILLTKEKLISEYRKLFDANLLSSACNKLFITENLKKINFKEELQIYEDYCFTLDYLKLVDKIHILKDNYYNYYSYGNVTLSKKYRKNMDLQIKNLIEYLKNYYSELGINDKVLINNQFMFLLSIVYSNETKNMIDKKAIISNMKKYSNDPFFRGIIKECKQELNLKSKIFNFLVEKRIDFILYRILK